MPLKLGETVLESGKQNFQLVFKFFLFLSESTLEFCLCGARGQVKINAVEGVVDLVREVFKVE